MHGQENVKCQKLCWFGNWGNNWLQKCFHCFGPRLWKNLVRLILGPFHSFKRSSYSADIQLSHSSHRIYSVQWLFVGFQQKWWESIAQSAWQLAVRGSNPGGVEIFRTCPDQPGGPTQPPVQWVPGLSRG